MNTTVYRIADWPKHFENNRTRELKKLDWVPVPNKHDGDGFSELLDHADGMSHYGAWCLIVQVASKCDMRGTLLRDGAKPYDSQSLSRVTRGSKTVFDAAIPRLVSIGWLEEITLEDALLTENTQDGAEIPQDGASRTCARALKRREANERNGREGKGSERTEGNAGKPDSSRFVKTGEVVQNGKTNGWHPAESETEIEDLCNAVLGKDEMTKCGKRWRSKAIDDPDKLRRVLVEMRANEIEGGRIENRGAYAEDLWKRFA